MAEETFRCFYVEQSNGGIKHSLVQRPLSELPPGDVLIGVEYSSLNYKDALAAAGHRGVIRTLPHVPGIDAAGTVLESADPRFERGDKVIATSYEIGAERWGGWSERLRVPGDWVLSLPERMTTFDAMALGTAGLTAALCAAALQEHGVSPEKGEVIVTGATGGVGSLSVMLLARLGYRIAAVTGKEEMADRLRSWGAARVVPRSELDAPADKPLLPMKYAGGIDTVGGRMLSTLLRQTESYGCVAACGLVGGADLPITVYPFILRGITLAGISTVGTNHERRREIWRRLAGPWRIAVPAEAIETVSLEELPERVERILPGRISGRVVVDLSR